MNETDAKKSETDESKAERTSSSNRMMASDLSAITGDGNGIAELDGEGVELAGTADEEVAASRVLLA